MSSALLAQGLHGVTTRDRTQHVESKIVSTSKHCTVNRGSPGARCPSLWWGKGVRRFLEDNSRSLVPPPIKSRKNDGWLLARPIRRGGRLRTFGRIRGAVPRPTNGVSTIWWGRTIRQPIWRTLRSQHALYFGRAPSKPHSVLSSGHRCARSTH